MSGANKADRRCHPEVTSGLAWGHRELEPPHRCPPIAPIRFLPIKQPVFLLSKPCQQWSLGKRRGGWHPGGGSPHKHSYEVNKTCTVGSVQPMGQDRAVLPLSAGQGQYAGRPDRHSIYGVPKLSIKTGLLVCEIKKINQCERFLI